MNELKIAVTGFNGYIGGYVAQFLKNKGHVIYGLGRKAGVDFPFIHFELNKIQPLELNGIDVLIHCAYDFSHLNFQQSKCVNVDGSINLFTQAKQQGVKKIIYISSMSSFEDAVSNYGRIKFEIETYAEQFDLTIVRPGFVFSKNPKGFIGSISNFIAKSKVVPIVAINEKMFFPCHIEDLSYLINYLLNNTNNNNPIIAASESGLTFKELITTLAKAQQRDVLLAPVPYKLLFLGLKMAEIAKIKIGLRSDSLKYMKYHNKNIDFSATREIGMNFRSFESIFS